MARARRAASGSAAVSVRVEDELTPEWMAGYPRSAAFDPAVVKAVMESGEAVAFARIDEGEVVAIGRAVVTGDWMGLQAVEVAPAHRRRGLATKVVDTLLEWGASRGTVSAYLQVLPSNVAAMELYAGYGFETHHAYRYLRPPDSDRR